MRLVTSHLLNLAVLSYAASIPIIHHEVHETRVEIPHWLKAARASGNIIVPVSIGLTQQNLEKGEQWLYEVSDPASPKYGQHWSKEQLLEAFAPSNETVTSVYQWLESSGIARSRLRLSTNWSWMKFNSTITELEHLLKTEYHIFVRPSTKHSHIACDSYSLPSALRQHVDFITPGVHIFRPVKHGVRGLPEAYKEAAQITEKGAVSASASTFSKGFEGPVTGSAPLPVATSHKGHVAAAVNTGQVPLSIENTVTSQQCYESTYRECLQFLYSIPVNFKANPSNSLAVVEYNEQTWLSADLALWFANDSARGVGTIPMLQSVDGGEQYAVSDADESETMMDIVNVYTAWPQTVQVFQVGSKGDGAWWGNFLDAIDGSYCTYEGGDDGYWDEIYPDSSWPHPETCGAYAPPYVISTSYGWFEFAQGATYGNRQCYEYMKLGLAGTSVLYSSGDYGVAGNGGYCNTNNQYTYNRGRFAPQFPATCPYVTTVGSTEIPSGTNVVKSIQNGVTQPEQSTSSFGSGGGFSDIFAMPQYQASAVGSWWTNYASQYSYTSAQYNNSQQTRGFPDVSASGWLTPIPVHGKTEYWGGTSMSSPVFASILSLINQNRLNAGKSPIGFANPAFYANPSMFNDITVGHNNGCGTKGFSASPGWDPINGLGTPYYPAMLAYFMSLP